MRPGRGGGSARHAVIDDNAVASPTSSPLSVSALPAWRARRRGGAGALADGFGYTVFGRVIEGMDVVDKIKAVRTGPGDVPVETVTIKSIRIERPQ